VADHYLLPEVFEREKEVRRTLEHQKPRHADFNVVIKPPARVWWPDGSLAAAYGRAGRDILPDDLYDLLPYLPHSRGGRRDGDSVTFGVRPRMAHNQLPWAARSALDTDYPSALEGLETLGEHLDAMIAEVNPDAHRRMHQHVARSHEFFRFVGGFSGGIVNYDAYATYHRDRSNLVGSWNAMVWLRQNRRGGLFVVPAWRMAFHARDRHLLLHDAQQTLHGVTPIVPNPEPGWRTSLVYFCRKETNDLPPDQETRRAYHR
jgi:hypothetical protein